MSDTRKPPEGRPYFDIASWNDGYTRGYVDGHGAGERLGESALRDRLTRRLDLLRHDLQLGFYAIETPLQTLHEVEQIVVDRRGGCHGSRD